MLKVNIYQANTHLYFSAFQYSATIVGFAFYSANIYVVRSQQQKHEKKVSTIETPEKGMKYVQN